MKVITFSKRVTVSTTTGGPNGHQSTVLCNPGERLLFNDDSAESIHLAPGSAQYIDQTSDLTPYLAEPLPVHKWGRQRVLFYRPRGIGDQLIASALSRFAREILGADAHQLSDKVHEPIWAYNSFIGGAPLACPLHLDAIWRAKGRAFFSRAFFLESVSEWDSDSEQPNVYDRIFQLIGIDPARVPIKYKRPTFVLTQDDIVKRNAWLANFMAQNNFPHGYVIAQFRGTNKVRSFPLPVIEKVLKAAQNQAQARGLAILCCDDQPFSDEVLQLINRTPLAVNVAGRLTSARTFGSLIAGANLVIGPDSCALHFAAAFEVPAVGIWGPFPPESRTKYYPNQVHIWHQQLCPAAPCYNFMPELPTQKCPNGLTQQFCEVFEGVTETEIYNAIETILEHR